MSLKVCAAGGDNAIRSVSARSEAGGGVDGLRRGGSDGENGIMSLKVCVIGSGSSGNSIFVRSDEVKILIDLGLSVARVEKSLAVLGETSDGVSVLLTHCHSDHVAGADKFVRRHPDAKLYCADWCYRTISGKIGAAYASLTPEAGDFYIGDVTVSPFRVDHDVPCAGFGIYSGGRKITVATDLGVFTDGILEKAADSDVMVIECNHDERLLRQNLNYSYRLKERILSEHGHLSNAACGEAIAELAHRGVKQFVLAHLSRENNYPELAFETVREVLGERGISEDKASIEVATQDGMSSLFVIGKGA